MSDPAVAIDQLDWADIGAQLDAEGHAVLSGLLAPGRARELARRLVESASARHVSLASARLGRGEFLLFGARLPEPLATWRTALYRRLAPIANRWQESLALDYRYPKSMADFLQRNRAAGQAWPLSRLDRLGPGDYLALHQSNDGAHVFPMQLVLLLSEPGVCFTGGEFVMTEQRPRKQSRPMVLPLRLGDAAIITTAGRPASGSRACYRASLRHAIGEVRQGERIGAELSFHDTPSDPFP